MKKIEAIQTTGNPWWKAFLISIILHGALLASIGWFVMNVSAAVVPSDDYIELDLADVLPAETADGMSENGASLPVATQGHSVNAMSAGLGISTEKATPSVQVASSDGSMLTADTSSVKGGQDLSVTDTNGSPGTGSDGINIQHTGDSSNSPVKNRGSLVQAVLIEPHDLPEYSDQTRQQGIKGVTIVRIHILTNGSSDSVEVYRTSGYRILDDAAVAAAWQWRFHPGYYSDSGELVAGHKNYAVTFGMD
jgi:periplasmic protein TonB